MQFWEYAGRFVAAIIALALVLACAWLLLRWMNRRVPGLSGGANRLIQILDRVSVGKTSSIILLRVQDKVILVAVSEHAMEKLYEFDDPDGEIALPPAAEFPNFSDALKDAAKRFQKRGKNNGDDGGNKDE